MPLPDRICEAGDCEFTFRPKRKTQRFCSIGCRNRHTARASAELRGAKMRGRKSTGRGRYVKYMGEMEHRVNAAALIGRPLKPGEVVHHLDGNKDNNAPHNLIVMSSQKAHAKLGHDGGKGRLNKGKDGKQ